MTAFHAIEAAFHRLGLPINADAQQVKQAYKELSLKQHPDRVASGQRDAAEKQFKELSALTGGGSRITPDNINAVRDARAAAGSTRRIWLTPAAAPLVATFALLAGLTYVSVGTNLEKSLAMSRPHGLLGPTVNPYLRDADDHKHDAQDASGTRYQDRLHKQNVDAKYAEKKVQRAEAKRAAA